MSTFGNGIQSPHVTASFWAKILMKCLVREARETAASFNFVERNRRARSEPGFLLGQHFRKKRSFLDRRTFWNISILIFISLYVMKSQVFYIRYTAKSFVFIVKAWFLSREAPEKWFTSRWGSVCRVHAIWLLTGPSFGRLCRLSLELSRVLW